MRLLTKRSSETGGPWGVGVAVGVVLSALAAALGCTGTNAVGPGGDCFLATDCDDGLACVPQADGRRVCSADFSGIVSTNDGGAMDEEPALEQDSGGNEASADVTRDQTAPDTGNPDTGESDTGGPDTGEPDTGGGDEDAGDDAAGE
jgi:hypothetical protein